MLILTGIAFLVVGLLGIVGVFDQGAHRIERHPFAWNEAGNAKNTGRPKARGGRPPAHQPGKHHPVTGPHRNNSLNRSAEGSIVIADPVCPMFRYTGRQFGADACFCNKAQNPSCNDVCHCYKEGCDPHENGIEVSGESVSFFSFPNVQNCRRRERVLTIPKSYFSHISDLRNKCGSNGTKALLTQMLVVGFARYQHAVGNVSVSQCIHKPASVSVHWLHLHTFCTGGRADGMPNKFSSYCATMHTNADAQDIANHWVNAIGGHPSTSHHAHDVV